MVQYPPTSFLYFIITCSLYIRFGQVDEWVDNAAGVSSAKELKQLLKETNATLGNAEYLVGKQLSLADMAVWAALQAHGGPGSEKNVQRWYTAIAAAPGPSAAAAFLHRFILKAH